MDYQKIIEDIYNKVQEVADMGKQADYIPALAKVNPNQIGVCLKTLDGKRYTCGKSDVRFSIQSISKVFSLAMALSSEKKELWTRMGKEPSGNAFNSLVQLELENGIPRNPFINAGAIVVADVLLSNLPNPEEDFISFVRCISQSQTVNYNFSVARSERSQGYLNAAIANLLKYHNNIENDIEHVLQFYFLMCSIEMNCEELSDAFLCFADHTKEFNYQNVHLTASQVKRINAIMQTCGFYDESGEFSYLVGLPGKSGVGGGIAAICPKNYAVTVFSPRLNEKGNSVVGMKFLELLTTETKESIF